MKFSCSRALPLAVLVVATWTVGCGDEPVRDPLAAAQRHIADKKYASAVIELKSLLTASPKSAEGRFLLGLALMEQGQFAPAMTEFDKAVELGHDTDLLKSKRATTLLANGRTQELLSTYGGLRVESAPAQAELRTAVAVAHMQSRRIAEAQKALDQALEAVPGYGWAMLSKARIAVHQEQFEAALGFIDQAIQAGTVNGEAWHMKGALLQSVKRDLAGAEQAYKASAEDRRFATIANVALAAVYIELDRLDDLRRLSAAMKKSRPGHPTTALVEAQLAYLDKRLPQARELLDRLLKAAPNDPQLLLLSGVVDLTRGALLPAESQLGKAVQVTDGAPVARRLLASTYLRLGQPDKALTAMRPLVEVDRPDPGALALAGEAYLMLGQPDRAESLFGEALRLRPDDIQLRTALALTDLARGRSGEGLASLEKLAAADASTTATRALIAAHMRRGDHVKALAAIDTLASAGADAETVALLRGHALRAKGDLTRAREAFDQVLKLVPGHFSATANLAALDQAEGRAEEARQRLQAVIKADPRSAPARLTLVSMMRSVGDRPDAIQGVLADAVAAMPTEASLRVALVDHHLAERDSRAALNVAQQALSAFADQPEVLDAVGRAQAASGQIQQAISSFGRLAALQPRRAHPQVRLADLHGQGRNWPQATAALRRAFEIEPLNDGVHRRMLSLARQNKDYSVVLGAARLLQRQYPQRVTGWFLEGDAEAGRGNWAGAIAAFKSAIGKPDAGSFPQIRVHDALLASGQAAAAERWATDWMRAHPQDVRFVEHLASIALGRRNHAQAERLLRQALAVDPASVVSLNNLAWVLAERADKEAVDLATKALGLAPNSPPVLDTLAKSLAAQGSYPQAIEAQQRAIAGGRNNPVYRLQLARILIAAGDGARARAELDHLASLGPQFAGQAEVTALREKLPPR